MNIIVYIIYISGYYAISISIQHYFIFVIRAVKNFIIMQLNNNN